MSRIFLFFYKKQKKAFWPTNLDADHVWNNSHSKNRSYIDRTLVVLLVSPQNPVSISDFRFESIKNGWTLIRGSKVYISGLYLRGTYQDEIKLLEVRGGSVACAYFCTVLVRTDVHYQDLRTPDPLHAYARTMRRTHLLQSNRLPDLHSVLTQTESYVPAGLDSGTDSQQITLFVAAVHRPARDRSWIKYRSRPTSKRHSSKSPFPFSTESFNSTINWNKTLIFRLDFCGSQRHSNVTRWSFQIFI
jgi:hypothetical protein